MGIERSEVLGGSRPSKSPGEHTAHSWAVLTQTLTTLLEPHNLLSSSPPPLSASKSNENAKPTPRLH